MVTSIILGSKILGVGAVIILVIWIVYAFATRNKKPEEENTDFGSGEDDIF